MRKAILIAVVLAMATARPETYREKEDFQFSRSSSDDGSKSGYYGAQRGNMGGNYERAHNMDSLAQHQMSGLISQVDGELGDASNTKTGSVYTAANSRGIYGSGHYDLSNLEGRNFQEGTSLGNSHSQSALTNSAYRDHLSSENRYRNSNSFSHSSRHSNSERSEYEQSQGVQNSNLRSGDSLYQQEYGAYDGSSSLSHTVSPFQNRLVSTRPMRILVRPGTRVTIPIATQTYDADHSASSYDASVFNQNSAKSDAEVITNNAHESNIKHVPVNKHYESSYSYRKEWEKHHTSPEAVPVGLDIDGTIPKTSELYDDSQQTEAYRSRNQQYTSNAADSHHSHSSNLLGYNTKSNLASSSHTKQQSDYDIQNEKISSGLNAFTSNAQLNNFDANNQQGTTNSKPKSYQSSYSYHKSWERQGDPYVIVPVPDIQNGQTSQRLSTTANSQNAYSSHQYGSKQSHQRYSSSNGLMDCDCDDEGHIRVARSYNTDQEVQQQQNGWEDYGQQSQNLWDDSNVQQTQNKWDNLENLGQQSQNQWDKIEDLGQESQTQWDKIQDIGQQTQSQWDNSGQHPQTQWGDNQDLVQKSQNQWDKIEDLGQQSENQWDKIEDLGQQSQNQWDKIQDIGQQSIDNQDLVQQSQNQWDQQGELIQQSQSNVDQGQAVWGKLEKSHKQSDQPNNSKSQEASVSIFENKNFDASPYTFKEISTTLTNLPQDNYKHSNIWDEKNYLHNFHDKHSRGSYNRNTVSNVETYYSDKKTLLEKEETVHQNDYLHQNIVDDTFRYSEIHHTSPLNNLWDKLDSLDSHKNNLEIKHSKSVDNDPSLDKDLSTTEKSKITENIVINEKDLESGDIETVDVINEKDLGRGDIETVDSEFETQGQDLNEYNHKINSYNENANQNHYLGQHKYQSEKSAEEESIQLDKLELPYDIQDLNQNILNENFDQHHGVSWSKQQSESFDQQSIRQGSEYIDQISDHFDSLNENTDQQKTQDNPKTTVNQMYENLYRYMKDQDMENQINQSFSNVDTNKNFDRNKMEEMPSYEIDRENFDQRDVNKNLEDKLIENFVEQNDHHQFATSGQIHENFNQQNIEQNFDDPNYNIEQENSDHNLMEFNNLNQNFDQERMIHQYNNIRQETLDQQTIEQNLQHFEEPSFEGNQNLFDYYKQQGKLDRNIDSSPVEEREITVQKIVSPNYSQNSIDAKYIEQSTQVVAMQTTVAPEPEQKGFWASVGKKFSNAKDKVTSWFWKKSE